MNFYKINFEEKENDQPNINVCYNVTVTYSMYTYGVSLDPTVGFTQ